MPPVLPNRGAVALLAQSGSLLPCDIPEHQFNDGDGHVAILCPTGKPMTLWQRILNRIAPPGPSDLSRLDRWDGLGDRTKEH